MNTEELEQSLKTEFESYLKAVFAEMRTETTAFQTRIEDEFDKYKTQLVDEFQNFSARFDSERTFDEAFSSTVGEHLRLARDEGARIAADAMVAAENLRQSEIAPITVAAPVETRYDAIRDAVNDISSKGSQSTILKALVEHAAEFAPRGAFFLIKSEHFVGWKVFGTDADAEDAVRDIHFPISGSSILGSAIAAKSTADNSEINHDGDAAFLDPLKFGRPDRMCAIPLIARGRGVAVLYADHGAEPSEGANVNRGALETLVSVAGLTVELLASMQTAKAENREVGTADFEDVSAHTAESAQPENSWRPEGKPFPESEAATPFSETLSEQQEPEQVESYADGFESPVEAVDAEIGSPDRLESAPPATSQNQTEPVDGFIDEAPEEPGFTLTDSPSFESSFSPDVSNPNPFDAEPATFDQFSPIEEAVETPSDNVSTFENPFAEAPYPGDDVQELDPATAFDSAVETTEPAIETFEPAVEFEPAEPILDENARGGELIFDAGRSMEAAPSVSSPFDQSTDSYEPATVASSGGFGQQIVEPVIETPVPVAPTPRLSNRQIDLPIEVPEDERRIHNDARRFARLLVSEIKLYNEKKVVEGREAQDLYNRLREAIDRSREMYDKRVQPPVAAKFDYFHYEIVNSLADGNGERLGVGYPGASV